MRIQICKYVDGILCQYLNMSISRYSNTYTLKHDG